MTGAQVVDYVAGLQAGDVMSMTAQARAGHAPAVAFLVAYGAYKLLRRRGLTDTDAKAELAPLLDKTTVVVKLG